MRDAFVKTIYTIAQRDKDVVLLLGDIGAFLLRDFFASLPDQILNAGIAEANMIGVAAGLAMNGKKPFVYSITPFVTARCYEQVKDDIAYPRLNVKIVGVGSGIAYTPYGPTHHSIDDISLMRGLPNMTVVSPADPREAEEAMSALAEYPGPAYLRLALASKPLELAGVRPQFVLGKANFLRRGKDVSIMVTGEVTMLALQAAEILAKRGIEANILNVHTIKPLDGEAIREAVAGTKAVVVVEEHNIIGGLGSAVAEASAEQGGMHIPFGRIGLQDVFAQDYGDRFALLERFGISAGAIVEKILKLLNYHE
jgi:transketolase